MPENCCHTRYSREDVLRCVPSDMFSVNHDIEVGVAITTPIVFINWLSRTVQVLIDRQILVPPGARRLV